MKDFESHRTSLPHAGMSRIRSQGLLSARLQADTPSDERRLSYIKRQNTATQTPDRGLSWVGPFQEPDLQLRDVGHFLKVIIERDYFGAVVERGRGNKQIE